MRHEAVIVARRIVHAIAAMALRALVLLWSAALVTVHFAARAWRAFRMARSGAPAQVAASSEINPNSVGVEAIFQAAIVPGARIVSITGAGSGVGVSSIARALAQRCGLAGRRTLLVEANHSLEDMSTPIAGAIHHCGAYDVYVLAPSAADLLNHRIPAYLRAICEERFADYQSIVFDCAPAKECETRAIPGPIAARAADAAVLVCLGGEARAEELTEARRSLAGAQLIGVIVNGRDQPTLGQEIAREAMRLSRYLPGWSRRIAGRCRASEFLDVRI